MFTYFYSILFVTSACVYKVTLKNNIKVQFLFLHGDLILHSSLLYLSTDFSYIDILFGISRCREQTFSKFPICFYKLSFLLLNHFYSPLIKTFRTICYRGSRSFLPSFPDDFFDAPLLHDPKHQTDTPLLLNNHQHQ